MCTIRLFGGRPQLNSAGRRDSGRRGKGFHFCFTTTGNFLLAGGHYGWLSRVLEQRVFRQWVTVGDKGQLYIETVDTRSELVAPLECWLHCTMLPDTSHAQTRDSHTATSIAAKLERTKPFHTQPNHTRPYKNEINLIWVFHNFNTRQNLESCITPEGTDDTLFLTCHQCCCLVAGVIWGWQDWERGLLSFLSD